MGILEWNENFSVGIEHIDEQHKMLLQMINKLYESMKQGRGNNIVEEVLTELFRYTENHFKSEEELFEKYDYPEKEKHCEEHRQFIHEIQEYKRDYENGRILISFELMDYLKNWLIKHIVVSDKNYAQYLTSMGAK